MKQDITVSKGSGWSFEVIKHGRPRGHRRGHRRQTRASPEGQEADVGLLRHMLSERQAEAREVFFRRSALLSR
jgi:hypothetical protein